MPPRRKSTSVKETVKEIVEEVEINQQQTKPTKLESAPVFLPDGTESTKKRKAAEAFEESKQQLKSKKKIIK